MPKHNSQLLYNYLPIRKLKNQKTKIHSKFPPRFFHVPVKLWIPNAQINLFKKFKKLLSKFLSDAHKNAPGEQDPAFLQVGTWVYPLVKGKSPVLKSKESAYMFPDLDDSIVGKIYLKSLLAALLSFNTNPGAH